MGAASDERRAEIVRMLSEAVDSLAYNVTTGRYGFDYAVKSYVEGNDNELSHAFQAYIEALSMGDETSKVVGEEEGRNSEEIRRVVLTDIARQFNVPEMTDFVAAVLKSQDERISIGWTLDQQAALLHKALQA